MKSRGFTCIGLPVACGLLWLCAVALAGCSSSGPDIVPIEGTITYQGEPVPNVRIYFFPTSGRFSWGLSDEQGRFVLDYDYDHDGAKVDTHTVWLVDEGRNVDPTLAMSGGAGRKKRSPELAAVIAKHSQDKSTLQVEVTKPDKNFQLKLD
jgi:hypothetical protein